MIILLRRWNGDFPSWEETRSDLWFDKLENSSLPIATWILSCSRLTWRYRSSVGYLGEWSFKTDSNTYQWRCWTSELFARMAYKDNTELFDAEKNACQSLTSALQLELVNIATRIEIEKDPAGLTTIELDDIIEKKKIRKEQ